MGKQNLNRQYIIEGLSAGFFVVVGSIGCILLTVGRVHCAVLPACATRAPCA
jgi:hypothetical protein